MLGLIAHGFKFPMMGSWIPRGAVQHLGADLVTLITDNAPGGGGNADLLDDLSRPDLADQCWSAVSDV